MLLTVCIGAPRGQPLLHECVESVRGVADEIVLASPGDLPGEISTERVGGARTTAIVLAGSGGAAEEWRVAGAGVGLLRTDERWSRESDAIFDRALAAARGDWVLFLEGHERLDQHGDLRRELASTDGDALSLTTRTLRYPLRTCHRAVAADHPLTHGATSSIDRRDVRLFRRCDGIRFGGRLDPSVERSLEERGAVVRASRSAILAHPILITGTPGRLEWRLTMARRWVERHPTDPVAWLDLGRSLLEEAGQPAAARTSFLEAWRLRPEPEAGFGAAQALAGEERFDAALDAVATLTQNSFGPQTDVSEADVWELRGEMLRALERTGEAVTAYERALALDGDRPAARIGLVERLCEQGRSDRAEGYADWLRAHHPGLTETWIAVALVHLARARPLSAIEALGIALDVEPGSATARYDLAIAYARLGAGRQARAALERAHETSGGIALANAQPAARPARTPATDLSGLARGGVISFIPHIAGGAGRVAVDIIRALDGRYPQALVTFDRGSFSGLALHDELAELDVPVVSIGSGGQLASLQRRLEPAVLLCHSTLPFTGAPFVPTRSIQVSISHGGDLLAASHHDGYVCLSPSHRRYHAYLPEDRVEVIANGVDLERFAGAVPDLAHWRGDAGDGGSVRIAMLTRLDHSKFPRRLLHYLEPIHDLDVTIVIAGQGPRRWEIQPDLHRFAIGPKVRFIGAIPSRAVPGFLAAADIGLHLTETHHETLSVSILEMLAAGLPIVAQPRGCLPDLVDQEVNGFLFEREAEIASALRRLVLSKAERLTMGAASRERAKAYDIAHFEDAWRAYVARCVAEHRRRCHGEPPPPAVTLTPAKAAALVERLGSRRRQTVDGAAASRGRGASFLIATTPRTGGALWCDALQSTGVVGFPQEDLAPWTYGLRGRTWRHRSLDEYLMSKWTLAASPHGVYGCRLAIDQFAILCESAGTPDWPARWLDRIAPPVWAFLRRRDRTAQAVSLYLAEATGLWWDVGEPEIGVQPVDYDRAGIAACRARIEEADRAWCALFDAFPLDPIEIYYEDLIEDLEGSVRRLLARLGVEPPEPFTCRPAMRSEVDDRVVEWRQRYEDGA
jgi:trehalose 2-sulfotransferase